MATISQLPAELTLNTVAGSPASLQFNVNVTGPSGPIPWSDISNYSMVVSDQYGDVVVGGQPTVTSPSANVILVSWTGTQTAAIGTDTQSRMAFSVYISSVGPYALTSGQIVMTPASYPA